MSILTTTALAAAATLAIAYAVGQFTTRSLYTEIEINAPASTVWATLTDTASFPEWNPFIKSLTGDLTVGNRLAVTLQSEGNAPMNFTPTILKAQENQELRWLGKLGAKGIFDGEHYYILQETAQGTTQFRHGENFSGMLAYVLFALIGEDTEKGFTAMNDALKARVEAKS